MYTHEDSAPNESVFGLSGLEESVSAEADMMSLKSSEGQVSLARGRMFEGQ
jgi:hypothetical protein